MKSAIEQEISWCESHRGESGKGKEFEEGFIAGLKQALYFESSVRVREDESSNLSTPTETDNEKFCLECGHSESRHNTAGGFCKHCPCNAFVDTEPVERRHIDSMDCWCHPEEIFEADNGSKVVVHKGHGEELPPPSIIAEAIADAMRNT